MIKIVLTKYEKLLDKYIDGDLNWVTLKRKKPYIEKYIQDGLFVEVVSDKLSHL
jgi:predicted membrane-bound spermidine synthase